MTTVVHTEHRRYGAMGCYSINTQRDSLKLTENAIQWMRTGTILDVVLDWVLFVSCIDQFNATSIKIAVIIHSTRTSACTLRHSRRA